MGRRKGLGIPGLSFSWKRAVGITSLKQKIARTTGIPTTREGRRRKFGPFGLWVFGDLLLKPSSRVVADAHPGPSADTAALGCASAFVGLMGLAFFGCAGVLALVTITAPSRTPIAAPVRRPSREPVATMMPRVESGASESLPVAAEVPDAMEAEPSPPAQPAATFPSFAPPLDESRIWTSGQFATDATFAGMINRTVRLKKADGTIASVPLDKLSEADQQWISERLKRGK